MYQSTNYGRQITADSLARAVLQAQATRGMWSNHPDLQTYIWEMSKKQFVITSHRDASLMSGYKAIYNMNGEEITDDLF